MTHQTRENLPMGLVRCPKGHSRTRQSKETGIAGASLTAWHVILILLDPIRFCLAAKRGRGAMRGVFVHSFRLAGVCRDALLSGLCFVEYSNTHRMIVSTVIMRLSEYIYVYTHTHNSLTIDNTHNSLTQTHTYTHAHSHSHSHSHSHPPTHAPTHTLSLYLSLSHTHDRKETTP